MRKTFLRVVEFILFLVIGVVLLWLAFRNVEFRKLVEGLKGADYRWVLLSIIFGLVAYISRARRWVLLISPLGYSPTLRNTFLSMMTGYLANLALPRVGELTRCIALGKKEKIPVDQLFGTVIVERTVDLISLLIIMLVLILIRGEEINRFLKEAVFIPLHEKVFSVIGFTWIIWSLIFLTIVISLFFIFRYRKNLRQIGWISKLFDIVKGMINGFKTISKLKSKWEFIFHTVFLWVNYTLMTWVVVFAIEPTSHLNLGDGIFLLVIGGLAMSAPVQSGLGAFHYIVSRGLSFVEGVRIEDGLIYAFLAHESQMIFIIIAGMISFFLISRRRNGNSMQPGG